MLYTDETPLPFGVHKGKKLANIPASWFLWYELQPWAKEDLKTYINIHREILEKEARVRK